MKVTVGSKVYVVKFNYDAPLSDAEVVYAGGDWYRDSRCLIYCDDEIVSTGSASNAPGDIFSKRVGRKIAFERAIMYLFPLDRDARTAFWKEYLRVIRL